MALKVGDLYVLLSAKTSAFGKAMESAAKTTEKVAKRIKAAAREIGQVGTLMAVGIGAALAVAAKHNAAVAAEVQRSKDVFATFANEIATMMLPAIHEMNAKLREMLGWWQALSPETKAHIAHWVELATSFGLAALAVSRVAGVVGGLMPLFRGLGAVLSLINAPLIVVLAAVVALGVAVALLHKAWRENWGGIQEKTRSVIEAISGYWQSFKGWLQNNFFDWFVDQWAAIEKSIAHAMNFLKHPLDSGQRAVANRGADEDIDKWAKLKAGAIGNALKLAAEKVAEGAKVITDEWRLMLKEISDAVSGLFGKGKVGSIISAAKPEFLKISTAQRLSDEGGQGTMDAFYKSASVESLSRSKKLLDDEGEQGNMTAALAQQYEREVDLREHWNGQLQSLAAGMKAAGQTLLSKLGGIGDVVNSAIQGFQMGGVWGALIAVIVELLSKFDRFQELMDIAQGQLFQLIEQLRPGLSALVDAFKSLMGAAGMITAVVGDILNPILEIIAKVFERLAPVLGLVSTALQPVAQSFQLLGGLFEMLDKILKPVFDLISLVLRGIGVTILGAMWLVGQIWNGIVDALIEILKAININGELNSAIVDLSRTRMNTNLLERQMQDLAQNGYEPMIAESARTSEAIGKMGDAADRATEQISNMPKGIKVALLQWTAATGSSTGPSFGSIRNQMERESFLSTGNPTFAWPGH